MNPRSTEKQSSLTLIKWLTFLMFMMFAMTTDAVGVIIPEVMKKFHLGMTAAGLLHYVPMIAIAFSGIMLGFIADKFGRKKTITAGLSLFVVVAFLFIFGNSFPYFLSLMLILGISIAIFKTGALALIGDISKSTRNHTSNMNAVEGFFGVGAIIGPFVVSYLLSKGIEWKWLYVIAGIFCAILIVVALLINYPDTVARNEEPVNLKHTFSMLKNPYAVGFSLGTFLYVAAECAIYVWMPTLVAKYEGNLVFVATYSLSIFFILRAAGRFLGTWVMARYDWSLVLAVFTFLILMCFLGSIVGGVGAAIILLPLSGLFMSVVYPTLNSRGISCFPKSNHGSIAGVLLFFTAVGAALGPLSMGAVSDLLGHNIKYGFILAAGYTGLLFTGSLLNLLYNPTKNLFLKLDQSEYEDVSK